MKHLFSMICLLVVVSQASWGAQKQSAAENRATAAGNRATAAGKKHNHKAPHREEHHAHVHGLATLTVAVESDTQVVLNLESPAESFLGFEHDPKTPAEKKTQEDTLSTLSLKASEFFSVKGAQCKVTPKTVKIEKHSGEEHADIDGEWAMTCDSIKGRQLDIHLGQFFPKIETLKVQVLGQKQHQIKIARGVGQVAL